MYPVISCQNIYYFLRGTCRISNAIFQCITESGVCICVYDALNPILFSFTFEYSPLLHTPYAIPIAFYCL